MSSLSAQGTRLNRRGRENRKAILDVAIGALATGAPEAMSANRIAREAGVTWGTIQHQFGDADGVWAAVLDVVARELDTYRTMMTLRSRRSVAEQVTGVVDWLWRALDSPQARAAQTIRMGLFHDHDSLMDTWPKTAVAVEQLEKAWGELIDEMFEGLDASPTKLRRLRSTLPSAMRGIHMQSELSSRTDAEDARRCLADCVTAYLAA